MQPPFSGMNPYLELPYYWPGFHNELIFCIHEELNARLPPGYIADIEQRTATLPDEANQWYIEIRTIGKDRRVVAILEVLSPSNKAAGSLGWKDYKQKQRELLCSDTHLMEIDLLRYGAHTVAAPLQELPPRDQWDYIVSLYRAPDRLHFPYWLINLSEPLPEVQVPLLQGDPDVLLDLQAAFEHAFRAGRYADDIDYSEPPTA